MIAKQTWKVGGQRFFLENGMRAVAMVANTGPTFFGPWGLRDDFLRLPWKMVSVFSNEVSVSFCPKSVPCWRIAAEGDLIATINDCGLYVEQYLHFLDVEA